MKLHIPLILLQSLLGSFSSLCAETVPVPISAWDELRANDIAAQFILAGNITVPVDSSFEVASGRKFHLAGGGYTLTGTAAPLDGKGSSRAFYLSRGAKIGKFTLSNVSFSKFESKDSFLGGNSEMLGGVILGESGWDVILDGCSFSGNGITNGIISSENNLGSMSVSGGAIALGVSAGTTSLDLRDCVFYSNYVSSSVTHDSTVLTASFSLDARGGALSLGFSNAQRHTLQGVLFEENYASSFLWLNDSTREYNHIATARGGAIYDNGSVDVFLSDCSFNKNHVMAGVGRVYEGDDNPQIRRGNVQAYGGAIWSNTLLTLERCVFENNYATIQITGEFMHTAASNNGAYGGAIYSASGELEITDSIFRKNGVFGTPSMDTIPYFGNLPQAGGGAIYGGGNLKNCSFSENYVSAFNKSKGGAIALDGGIGGILSDCTFDNNYVSAFQASYGGAISGSGTLINCSFTGNSATTDYSPNVEPMRVFAMTAEGGAVYGGSWVLDNCSLTGNEAVAMMARGGAFFGNGTITGGRFVNNRVLSNISSLIGNNTSQENGAYGGAVYGNKRLSLTDCTLVGNYASSTGGSVFRTPKSAGGAVYLAYENITGPSYAKLSGCTFISNYAAAVDYQERPGRALGGAVYSEILTLFENCQFFDNYVSASTSYGGAIFVGAAKDIVLLANGADSVFSGNRQGVTQVDPDTGKPLDGESNALYLANGARAILQSGKDDSIVFYDNVSGEEHSSKMEINVSGLELDRGNILPNAGNVIFKEGVSINNLTVNLHNGTMIMSDRTTINGNVNASSGSTFRIDGFTHMNGLYSVKPPVVRAGGEPHTVLIHMTDEIVGNMSEEAPIWSFSPSGSLNSPEGAMSFVLDIGDISFRPETLRPYVFSHFGQTQELIDSVDNAASVTLVDSDGWRLEISRIYEQGGQEFTFFDYLSGQYGTEIPVGPGPSPRPEPGPGPLPTPNPLPKPNPTPNPTPRPEPEWTNPEGLGSVHVNTLWTTVRSLWSLSSLARSQPSQRFEMSRDSVLWVSGLGDYFSQDNQAVSEGYDFRSWGYSAGGEYSITQNEKAGVAFGQTFGKYGASQSFGNIDQNALMALLYVNSTTELNSANALNLDVQVGYGTTENKGGLYFPALRNERLDGKWRNHAWVADMKGTWTNRLNDKTLLEVYLGIQYTDAVQSDTTISGNKYRYILTNGEMSVLRANMGAGLRRNGSLGGRKVNGYINAGIGQDMWRDLPRVEVQGRTRNWMAYGSKPGKTTLEMETGFRVQLAEDWSVGVDYSLETGNKNLNQSGRASLMFEF